jgi:hypothetical protein
MFTVANNNLRQCRIGSHADFTLKFSKVPETRNTRTAQNNTNIINRHLSMQFSA